MKSGNLKKIILVLPVLVAGVFICSKLLLTVESGEVLETIYWILTIAAIFWTVMRAFVRAAKLKDRDALFTGALGLGMLAVCLVYYFAFILIIGTESVLDISDFSGACSYLFFLSAITLLLLPPFHLEKVFRVGVSVISAAIVLLAAYSVVVNNNGLLYIVTIAAAVICAALSVYLLCQARKISQLKPARLFALSMIFIGAVDIAVYVSLLAQIGTYWDNVFNFLYMPVFIWISEGLLRLRERG